MIELSAALSIEVIGSVLVTVLGFVAILMRRHTAKPIRALWRMLYSVVLRVGAWVKADCNRCRQQLMDAPLPLQVAGVLFVFNGWGIVAVERYAGISIGLLDALNGMFVMAAFGLIGYGLVLRLRLRRARAGTK